MASLGEFGWNGAAGMYVQIDPTKKLTMVYAQHMLNNQEDYVNPRLRNILYSCRSDIVSPVQRAKRQGFLLRQIR